MPFPKSPLHNDPADMLRSLHGTGQKLICFNPMFFCEFFEGMDVLQVYGEESKEYIFGLYFSGKYCGHVYFGEKFTQEKLAEICSVLMPPTWDKIQEYVNNCAGVWYYKYDQSQYAWIYEKVITKTE